MRGGGYIIPTLAVYDSAGDIDFDVLPEKFVLKCNHDGGSVCICTDKNTFDKAAARKKLSAALKRDQYWFSREWPYKDVPRKILAEEYIALKDGGDLKDYKFFVFNGKVRALFIASDRNAKDVETKFDFFDENFNFLPFTNGHPNSAEKPEKPELFDEMKAVAEKLGEGIPHVRVDLYEVDGKIYFGELTFSHWGGFMPFVPHEWDEKFGSWLELPPKYNEK